MKITSIAVVANNPTIIIIHYYLLSILLLLSSVIHALDITKKNLDFSKITITNLIDSTISVREHEDVEYNCVFENLWTKERHPRDYPYDAMHWKEQVLASHNFEYSMWKENSFASTAVRKLIEKYDVSFLTEEIMTNHGSWEIGYARHIRNGEEQNQNNNNNAEVFEFEHPIRMSSSNNHYLSVIAKMAPSPDWFSGFYDVNVIKEDTMTWYDEFSIETYPFDAGIDDGTAYYTIEIPTEPPQPITQFTVDNTNNGIYLNPNGTDILPVARYTCALVGESEVEDFHSETIQTVDSNIPVDAIVEYGCSFVNEWNASRHPKHFPTGDAFQSVHWTKPILASHNIHYSMWREGSMASEAVEKLAELGGVSDILIELMDHGDIDYAIGYDKYLYHSTNPNVHFDPIPMTQNRRYISVLSKLAPSPDWFAGHHDFNTVNEETNTWYQEFNIPLFPYDAGTEEGSTYVTVNNATDPKQPISKFTSSLGDNVFMKRNTVMCVALLTCKIILPSSDETIYNNNNDNDDSSIRPSDTRSPSTTTLIQQEEEEESTTTQRNKIAIIGVTVGTVVAVLIAGSLLTALFCQRNDDDDYDSDDDDDSLPSYIRRDLMIQKIRASLSIQTEHDASTISTHDHHYLDNNQDRRLEVVNAVQQQQQQKPPSDIIIEDGMF